LLKDTSMKKALIFLIAVATIFVSCQHRGPVIYTSTGSLDGQVLSNMVCGYGYVIISGNTEQKFVDPLPAGCGIYLKTATFPIKVNYNWHKKAEPNPCNFIVIDAIERVN